MLPVVKKECILCGENYKTKDEAIRAMVHAFGSAGYVTDEQAFYQDVLKREEEFPTFIGCATAIPHGRSDATVSSGLCVTTLSDPIVWTEDGESVSLIIMLAVVDGKEGANKHLRLLAKLSRLLMHDDFREELQNGNAEETYALLTEKLQA